MSLPAVTGLGLPLLVTIRLHLSSRVVVTVVLLFAGLGSLVVAETVEVAVMVPAAMVGATFTTTMMSAEALAARLGSVQVTDVVVVQVHPSGAETETNVVLAGIASVKLTAVAAAGPLLVTACV